MSETLQRDHRRSHHAGWPARSIGAVVVLLGLTLGVGGAWLAAVGGSWYYVLAGSGLLVAGVLLLRGKTAGAWWFFAVLVATVLWTVWESGLDYWGWVPRVGLLLMLAFFVALLMPRLDRRSSRGLSWTLAGGCAIAFGVAFGLAFAPHHVTRAQGGKSAFAGRIAPAMARSVAAPQPAVAPAVGDWASYGHDNAATRFSPLAQITPQNVSQLKRAWTYRTGDIPQEGWGAETTPLKIGDTVYLCSARNIIIALDARTGEQRWRYTPEPAVQDKSIPYTAACRGVSYYALPASTPATASAATDAADMQPATTDPGAPDAAPTPTAGTAIAVDETDAATRADRQSPADPGSTAQQSCAARIIEGTLDGRLIAVDAATGEPCRDFGDNGQVRITDGMGSTPAGYVAINAPPTIVRGVVVTGHQVLDGQRRYEPSGVIQGYDARTGALRWAWDMVRPDRTGAPPPGEEYTRGTPNMWTTASGDEKLGYVYLPMGNSTGDYLTHMRTAEEKRYGSSLVALDVTTGKPVWRFQTVHHDAWDYDLGSQATLVDYPTGNGTVPALILPTKTADLYVLDRRTGRPLTGVLQKRAPGGGVEPGERTKTQPHSSWATLRKPDLLERNMWGLSPIDQMICRIQFRKADYRGIYTPPSAKQHFVQYPGYNGGSDWGGIAIDPQRGWIIANYNDMPNYNILLRQDEARKRGILPRDEEADRKAPPNTAPQEGMPYAAELNPGWRLPVTGLLCKEPPYGWIRAIDIATGKTVWDRPFGTGRENGPFNIPSHLPITIGTPNNGGAAVTAGGLIFIAAATDNLIRAIDTATGDTVWSDVLPAGGQATPMVYESGGRQYVVIVAAGHHFMQTKKGDYVIAYALPEQR